MDLCSDEQTSDYVYPNISPYLQVHFVVVAFDYRRNTDRAVASRGMAAEVGGFYQMTGV